MCYPLDESSPSRSPKGGAIMYFSHSTQIKTFCLFLAFTVFLSGCAIHSENMDVLPAIIAFAVSEVMRKKGLIKDGDMKLDV